MTMPFLLCLKLLLSQHKIKCGSTLNPSTLEPTAKTTMPSYISDHFSSGLAQ